MRALLLSLCLSASASAEDGWRTILTSLHAGKTIEFSSPSAAMRLGEGEALHPEIPAHNTIVEYEALLIVPEPGIYRFTLEVEGGVGALTLSDPLNPERSVFTEITEARGNPIALPGGDVGEYLIRVRFERSGTVPASLRTLWSGQYASGARFDFEPIPGRLVRQAPGSDAASGDQALRGRVLLEVYGCTSCHNPGAQGARAVGEKRSPEEYAALVAASWLWKNPRPLNASDAELVTERAPRELFDSSPPLMTLISSRGCLDPNDANTPRYVGLNEQDRTALAAGIESVKGTAGDPAPMDEGRRRYEVLGCTNCHTMNGEVRASLGRELGDPHDEAPDLGDVGWRLKQAWIYDVLTGSARARRPNLGDQMRMPSFPAELVAPIAEYLSASAGVSTEGDPEIPSEELAQLASAGRELAGTEHMACVSCHYLGERAPETLGPFDLTQTTKRLRREWFDAFMRSPSRLQPGATMPGLVAGGESVVHGVLDGDLSRQTEALWAWSLHAEDLADPTGTLSPERGVIGETPTVLVGRFDERALRLVGTPEGLHFGWDLARGQLKEAWVNPFLKAELNDTESRGAVVWRAPDGPSIVVGAKPTLWPTEQPSGPHDFSRAAHGGWGASRRLGELTMHETAEGRVLPEVVVLRTIELSNIDPSSTYWFRPGTGELKIEAVKGCDARKHPAPPGEAPWIELVPHPGNQECSVRVALRP
ncbi:MAG: hypothetical protein MK297_08680 [Planctomycetes bacterium]|nr:hypothetical protein [Planctomycetota bacterium]